MGVQCFLFASKVVMWGAFWTVALECGMKREFPACGDMNCTGSSKPGNLHLKMLKESVNLSQNNNYWLSLDGVEHWLDTRSVTVDDCQKEMVSSLFLDVLSLFLVTANGDKYSGFSLMICKRRKLLLKLQTILSWKDLQKYWRTKLFQNTLVKCRKRLRIFEYVQDIVLRGACHWSGQGPVAFVARRARNVKIKLLDESLSVEGIQSVRLPSVIESFLQVIKDWFGIYVSWGTALVFIQIWRE